ncbi:uncharacterized protein LOC105198005 [Solenopsis invicta]|nr:uncharacterized protein LOC105198005 [Solenopsis invicta]
MDYHKYYKIEEDGNYSIHFMNKDKLTLPEIRKIFSSYGNVLHTHANREEGGFIFIKYKTLKETLCCLKDLHDGNKIKILPEKSKMNKTKKMDKRDLNQQQTARMGNSLKKISCFSHGENFSNRESSTCMRSSNENNKSDDFSENFVYNHKPNQNEIKDHEDQLDLAKFDRRSSRQTFKENEYSDATMDYEKYYRVTKEGAYSIHFPNRKGLTSEELNNLFSSYGNVLSIYTNNSGLVFVKYETQETVIKCLKDLQNSNVITILPQKDKIANETKTTDQKNDDQRQAGKGEDISRRMLNNDKQFNSNFTNNEKFSENRKKHVYNVETSDWNKFEDTDISSTASCISKQSCKSIETEIKQKNTDPWISNEKFSRQQDFMDKNDQEKKLMRKQLECKFYSSRNTETDTKMNRDVPVSTCDYKVTTLVSDTEVKRKEYIEKIKSDRSALLVLLSKAVTDFSEFEFIPMQELIVANIHISYGMYYILHLLQKYNPISATCVKITEKTWTRYCHVYFKTAQDAEAAEEEFDNFYLSSKKLIVLRKSRLMELCK